MCATHVSFGLHSSRFYSHIRIWSYTIFLGIINILIKNLCFDSSYWDDLISRGVRRAHVELCMVWFCFGCMLGLSLLIIIIIIITI